MTISFLILAAITIGGMAAAMTMRNLVHCMLALTAGFAGLAALYLQLGAQFAGFTQILVYVGAVAILAVFVIMMTQHEPISISAQSWAAGAGIAGAVFAVLAWAVVGSASLLPAPPPEPQTTVLAIGQSLMGGYVLPLEIVGVLLTVALIGAVALAMTEKRGAR